MPIKTKSHYQLLLGTKSPILLPLHNNLSYEEHLTDCVNLVLIVTRYPYVSATSYQKIECFLHTKFTG